MRRVETDRLYERLEVELGYPVGAIQFVLNALNFALQDNSLATNGHTDASGLCRCFLEIVIDSFGVDAQAVLRDWNVRRSEDIGKIVVGLVNAGLMRQSDQDTDEDFEQLFDLDRDQSEWALKW